MSTTRGTKEVVRSIVTLPFVLLIWTYRLTLSPLMGGHCRFHPTCSQYALEAYREHGVWRGTVLTVRRLGRCHPLGKGGYDPVPVEKGDRGRSGGLFGAIFGTHKQ